MKKNSSTYPTVAMCIFGAASAAVSLQAGAFQLGQIQGASRIDEPLSAYINIMMSPRESQLETAISVLPDFAYRYDPVMNDALNTITATLVRNEYGHHYIALSSSRKLNLPLISFRLKAQNGENILIQNYSLAPNAPLPVIVQQPKATLSTRRRDSSPRSTVTQQLTKPSALAADGEYGPVKAGDTLWKIATRVAGSDAGKVLNQIFELNPEAFINGDINKLKQGVVLVLPASESQTALAATDNPKLNESSAIAPAIESPPVELLPSVEEPSAIVDELSVIDDDVFEQGGEFGSENTGAGNLLDADISTANNAGEIAQALTSAAPLDWRKDNPELAQKLDSLGDRYAALRARYAEQSGDQNIAAVSNDIAAGTTLPVISTTDASTAPSKNSSQEPALEELVDGKNPTSLSSDNSPPSVLANPGSSASGSRFDLPPWLLALLALTLIASAVSYLLYRTGLASRRKAAQVIRTEKDQNLKQQLAKKAQHRVMMEDEVERMLGEGLEDDGNEIEKTQQLHIDDVLAEQIDSAQIEATPLEDDSAQGRIDASISHGKYAEAEDLLREVIIGSPRNFTAKLRLAEVYYITEKISDFVEISQDIHAHHRPDISDEDWRRVMRMGKMIAPEQAPFSGPQSIVGDASAG